MSFFVINIATRYGIKVILQSVSNISNSSMIEFSDQHDFRFNF